MDDTEYDKSPFSFGTRTEFEFSVVSKTKYHVSCDISNTIQYQQSTIGTNTFVSTFFEYSLKTLSDLQCAYADMFKCGSTHNVNKSRAHTGSRSDYIDISNVDFWLKYHCVLSNVKTFVVFLSFFCFNNDERGRSTRSSDRIRRLFDTLTKNTDSRHEVLYNELTNTIHDVFEYSYTNTARLERMFCTFVEKYPDMDETKMFRDGNVSGGANDPAWKCSNDIVDFFGKIKIAERSRHLSSTGTISQMYSDAMCDDATATCIFDHHHRADGKIPAFKNFAEPSAPPMFDYDEGFEKPDDVDRPQSYASPLIMSVNDLKPPNYGSYSIFSGISKCHPTVGDKCYESKWRPSSRRVDTFLKIYSKIMSDRDVSKRIIEKGEDYVNWIWCGLLLSICGKSARLEIPSELEADCFYEFDACRFDDSGYFSHFLCILEDHARLSSALYAFFYELETKNNNSKTGAHWMFDVFLTFGCDNSKDFNFNESVLNWGRAPSNNDDASDEPFEKDNAEEDLFFSPSWWLSKTGLKSKISPESESSSGSAYTETLKVGSGENVNKTNEAITHIFKTSNRNVSVRQCGSVLETTRDFYKNLRGGAANPSLSEIEPRSRSSSAFNAFLIFSKKSYQMLCDATKVFDDFCEMMTTDADDGNMGMNVRMAIFGIPYKRMPDGAIRKIGCASECAGCVRPEDHAFIRQLDLKIRALRATLFFEKRSYARYANALIETLQTITIVTIVTMVSKTKEERAKLIVNTKTVSDAALYAYEKIVYSLLFNYKRAEADIYKRMISKNVSLMKLCKSALFQICDAVSPKFFETHKSLSEKSKSANFVEEAVRMFDVSINYDIISKDFSYLVSADEPSHPYALYTNVACVDFKRLDDRDLSFLKTCAKTIHDRLESIGSQSVISNVMSLLSPKDDESIGNLCFISLLTLGNNFKTRSEYDKLMAHLKARVSCGTLEEKAPLIIPLVGCSVLDDLKAIDGPSIAKTFSDINDTSAALDALYVYMSVHTKFKKYDVKEWSLASDLCRMFIAKKIKNGSPNYGFMVRELPSSGVYDFDKRYDVISLNIRPLFLNGDKIRMRYETSSLEGFDAESKRLFLGKNAFAVIVRSITYLGSCINSNAKVRDILANRSSGERADKCSRLCETFVKKADQLRILKMHLANGFNTIKETVEKMTFYSKLCEQANIVYDTTLSEGSLFDQCRLYSCDSAKKQCKHLKRKTMNVPSLCDFNYDDMDEEPSNPMYNISNSKRYFDISNVFLKYYTQLLPHISRDIIVTHDFGPTTTTNNRDRAEREAPLSQGCYEETRDRTNDRTHRLKWMFTIVAMMHLKTRQTRIFETDDARESIFMTSAFNVTTPYAVRYEDPEESFVKNADMEHYFASKIVRLEKTEDIARKRPLFFSKIQTPPTLKLLYDVVSKKLFSMDFSTIDARMPLESLVAKSNLFCMYRLDVEDCAQFNFETILFFKKDAMMDRNTEPNEYDWFILNERIKK